MSRFGKIELSDPRFEPQHLRFLTFNSPALGGRGDVALFVPPNAERLTGLPLVVLLHGVYCSHWSWALKGGAHLTAARMIGAGDIPPVVLAMPSDGLWAEGSGYVPHESADYEAWIVEDVIDCVKEVLPQLGGSEATTAVYITGLSMGGYGTLRLGAKYPRRFQGISAHSSVIDLNRLHDIITRRPIPYQFSSDDDASILHWLLKHQEILPPLRFDCGWDDHLINANREFHQTLLQHNIPHQYEEFPGGHQWPYWEQHLQDSLHFFAEIEQEKRNKQS